MQFVDKDNLIGAAERSTLTEFVADVPFDAAGALLPAPVSCDYEGPARLVARRALQRASEVSVPVPVVQRSIVAALALSLPARLAIMDLPASILGLYPAKFSLLCASLRSSCETYDWDYLVKDSQFVFGRSVPAGAQEVDLNGRLSPRVVLGCVRRGGGLRTSVRYVGSRGWGEWCEIHTDPRDLSHFNEAGWNACYGRIAEVLRLRPQMRGLFGVSWFYDPQLLTISPRLSYLQTTPLRNGAFLVRNEPGAVHTERALAKSPTRRKAFEAGLYLPVCHTLIWPRQSLLDWARSSAPSAVGSKSDSDGRPSQRR